MNAAPTDGVFTSGSNPADAEDQPNTAAHGGSEIPHKRHNEHLAAQHKRSSQLYSLHGAAASQYGTSAFYPVRPTLASSSLPSQQPQLLLRSRHKPPLAAGIPPATPPSHSYPHEPAFYNSNAQHQRYAGSAAAYSYPTPYDDSFLMQDAPLFAGHYNTSPYPYLVGGEKQAEPASMERFLEKQRKRKESHNAVERRRRDHINDMIKRLSELVPGCGGSIIAEAPASLPFAGSASSLHASLTTPMSDTSDPALKYCFRLNKGEILQCSVEYITHLQSVLRQTLRRLQVYEPMASIPDFAPSALQQQGGSDGTFDDTDRSASQPVHHVQ